MRVGRLPFRAQVEQVHKEVVGQLARAGGEHTGGAAVPRRAEGAHSAHQSRHLGSRQAQQLSLVNEQVLAHGAVVALVVVAESIGQGLEDRKRIHVGVLLGRVGASGRKGNLHVAARILSGLFDGSHAAKHDEVGHRHLGAAGSIELFLNAFEHVEHLVQLRRVVRRPVLLGRKAKAAAVGAAAHVAAAKRRSRSPSRRNQFGHAQP